MYYLQRILASTRLCTCMYIYSHPRLVATKNRLNFHRIVKYVLCGHKESGHVVRVQPRIQKLRLGNIREMQSSIVRKHTDPVDPGPYWHTWRRLKCPDSCIPPSRLRCCIKNRSIWACYLRSYWETDHNLFLRMTRFLPLITSWRYSEVSVNR